MVHSIGSNEPNVHSLWFNWILAELTNKRFKEFFGPNQLLVYRLNQPVRPSSYNIKLHELTAFVALVSR